MLDVARLRVLREVARSGSLSAAAGALSYTPSAVSQQIATLEREAGATLVERGARGVRLTEAGRVLVTHAEWILTELRAAEASLEAVADARGGRLRFGSFPTANARLMPQAVAAFRQRHPEVELTLTEADRDEGLTLLAAHELDLALVYEFGGVPFPPASVGQIALTHLLDDPLYIALAPSHPLARRRRLRLAELADQDWIQGVHHGSTIDVLPKACRAAGFEPHIAFRTDDQVTVHGLVAAGVGIALVPQLTVPAVRPDLVIRPLGSSALRRRVYAATPKGRYSLPAATRMLTLLHQASSRLTTQATQRLAAHH
jgi:DNA-binding transcriptional LysR family regulator